MGEGVESLGADCGLYNAQVFNTTFFQLVHLKLGKYYPKDTQLFFSNKNLKYISFMQILLRALRCREDFDFPLRLQRLL